MAGFGFRLNMQQANFRLCGKGVGGQGDEWPKRLEGVREGLPKGPWS